MKYPILLIFIQAANLWDSFYFKGVDSRNYEFLNNDYLHVPEDWFSQDLDHFNPLDDRTWKQRFFTNAHYYNKSANGPAFLFIGGEENTNVLFVTRGTLIDYAERFQALWFYVEHRYYGKSTPTENMSVQNLQYLTREQALADLATFIVAMNEKYELSKKTKWIAFGGSYPGALSVWLRLKYPHLVHGVVSSSAPLISKLDYGDYLGTAVKAIKLTSAKCLRTIKEGVFEINNMLSKNKTEGLNDKFCLCHPIENSVNNSKDISNLFYNIAGYIGGVVQGNNNNLSFIEEQPSKYNASIDIICDILLDNKQANLALDRLATVIRLMLKVFKQDCLAYNYEEYIRSLRNITWNREKPTVERQWTFQICTEYPYFQTSSFKEKTFDNHFPLEFLLQTCSNVFGAKFNETFVKLAVNRTNTIYGGLSINTTNIVFVHGTIDPWHVLGLLKPNNPESPVIIINGTSHMSDMCPSSKEDLPQLKAARRKIIEYISKWIKQ